MSHDICLNQSPDDPCRGPVEYRYVGHSSRPFPRCEKHFAQRLKTEEEIVRKYNPDGPGPPEGFDPADAGERWDSDY